jgi:hypothetical protein
MTATAEPEGEGADREYFGAIEELFVALRGAPLLLSPADWRVAQKWRRQGVPLELVRRVLGEVFAKRAERGTRGRVNSLRYCAAAVEAAWGEWQELQGPRAPPPAEPVAVAQRLAELAAALPEGLPGRQGWASRMQALAGTLEEVEGQLEALDSELLAAAALALEPSERATLEAEVAAAIARLAGRLPATELEVVRDQLWRRSLRRRAGLPLLTLIGR